MNYLIHWFARIAAVALITCAMYLPDIFPASAHATTAPLPTLRFGGLVGTATWVDSLDPAVGTSSQGAVAMGLVNAQLTQQLPNGNDAPALATWTVSKNHLVYTFTIRKNARFSNGDPVTAQDVVFSLTRLLLPATHAPFGFGQLGTIVGAQAVYSGKTKTLRGLKVLNSRTIQITIIKPLAWWLGLFTYETEFVLDRRVLEGKPAGTYLTDTCSANVGAGPFMFLCRNKGSGMSSFYAPGTTPTMTFVPNPYYYGPKPHIRVVMPVLGTVDISYRDFEANQLDVSELPSGEVTANQGKPGFARVLSSGINWLTPNVDMAPFNNIHCRLALAYAINQDTINRQVLRGTQINLYSVVPKGILGWYPGADNPHYNPTKARQELAQCPGKLKGLSLPYNATGSDMSNEMAAIQNMLSQVGITATLKGLPTNNYISIWNQGLIKTHTPILFDSWAASFPDPQQYFDWLLIPNQPTNISGWTNPTVTRLSAQADVTFNTQKRAALYRQASHFVLTHGAMILLGQDYSYAIAKPWVHGLVAQPYGGVLLYSPRDNNWANVSIAAH
jgi:oligopeptide transport system substrate-binding protein